MLKLSVLLVSLGLMTAAVAAADTYYRYESDSGSQSFTDDREQIPERYRDSARMFEAKSIFDYERTTVAKKGASRVAPPKPMVGLGVLELADAEESPLKTVTVDLGGGLSVDVPVGASDEPVRVVHGWDYRDRDGTVSLYPVTQVRQGDRILLETYDEDQPRP
jgi:hypothetical protein